jgi:integrase
MKITFQLKLTHLNKSGFAPIQMTVSWEGNRIRVATGCLVLPEHWDEKLQLVQVRPGTQHSSINPRITAARTAAGEAQEDARKKQHLLAEADLRAVITTSLTLAPVVAPAAIPVAGPVTFEGLYQEWIPIHSRRARAGSGRPLSKVAVAGLVSTASRLHQYALARHTMLRLEGMDMTFYQDFRTYVMDELSQSINTLGKHIDRLKSFLTWCEEEMDLPVHRHYRKFVAPRKRGRVDALNEEELRRIAGIDFHDPATRARLLELRGLVREQSNKREEWSAERWMEHVELARDKFLECCYTGLRISDANRVAWQHVHGQMIVLDNTAKNEATVYIPFYDDELFKPVALANRYEHRSPLDLLVPDCYRANEFLRVVQQLSSITRLKLTTKIGRKTFVTLKLYQGVPARLIMQSTGHQTEEAFNHYVGIDEIRLLEEHMRKSARRRAA